MIVNLNKEEGGEIEEGKFRCLKCFRRILPGEKVEKYKDGYAHSICLQ